MSLPGMVRYTAHGGRSIRKCGFFQAAVIAEDAVEPVFYHLVQPDDLLLTLSKQCANQIIHLLWFVE